MEGAALDARCITWSFRSSADPPGSRVETASSSDRGGTHSDGVVGKRSPAVRGRSPSTRSRGRRPRAAHLGTVSARVLRLPRGSDSESAARGAALPEQLSQRPTERVLHQTQQDLPQCSRWWLGCQDVPRPVTRGLCCSSVGMRLSTSSGTQDGSLLRPPQAGPGALAVLGHHGEAVLAVGDGSLPVRLLLPPIHDRIVPSRAVKGEGVLDASRRCRRGRRTGGPAGMSWSGPLEDSCEHVGRRDVRLLWSGSRDPGHRPVRTRRRRQLARTERPAAGAAVLRSCGLPSIPDASRGRG
ncbi:hypothetical protein SAMN05660464_3658 [Geodermatophilus dictyosporus]|uniref:Uncharacterized protein n=1 Tax=Geodermatophilus dictyosporus TaxID=1523247 RepID=A0A1I5RQ53_9ACTN|nr:hypothetical protein SAMN05660464_3658 [Geodermatophilus dictyosporus]